MQKLKKKPERLRDKELDLQLKQKQMTLKETYKKAKLDNEISVHLREIENRFQQASVEHSADRSYRPKLPFL